MAAVCRVQKHVPGAKQLCLQYNSTCPPQTFQAALPAPTPIFPAQVEQAQEELERRQAAAEAQAEELAARERSLRRQEDGLEGVKVGGVGLPARRG